MQRKPTQIPSTPARSRWVITAIAAAWIFWGFGYQTVWQRLSTQIDGTVVSSQDVPQKGVPRYATNYVFWRADGEEQSYTAGATDASIERSIPVGAHVRKLWGRLDYEIDGRPVAFPIAFYVIVLAVGTMCVMISINYLLSDIRRRKRESKKEW